MENSDKNGRPTATLNVERQVARAPVAKHDPRCDTVTTPRRNDLAASGTRVEAPRVAAAEHVREAYRFRVLPSDDMRGTLAFSLPGIGAGPRRSNPCSGRP